MTEESPQLCKIATVWLPSLQHLFCPCQSSLWVRSGKQPCSPFPGAPWSRRTWPILPSSVADDIPSHATASPPCLLTPGRTGQCGACTSVVANTSNRVWPRLHTSHGSWTHQGLLCNPCPQLQLPGLKIPPCCQAGDTRVMKA